mmetsp:Transcript_25441/g.39396  ORF Transcript_25441/g.39396 Transcript_25441/m.39396 type:complete len:294 (-) Transcript_25441:180-1061(-)
MADVFNTRDVSRDIFSATIGAITCAYVGQPLDTVKVRMQTTPKVYSGIGTSFAHIVRNEGATALWKGAVPTTLGMTAENAMAFGVNEALKRAFPEEEKGSKDANGPPNMIRPFQMGAITGCCSALVLLPSEVVKAKIQVAVGTVSARDIMKQMLKEQGLKSMFCGLDSQLARDASFYAVFFGGYELSCYLFRTYVPSMPEELNFFISGGFAGMFGWACAMPFDVPKTNVQSRYDTKVVGSYLPEMGRIVRKRGILGLYDGLGPVLIRAFPANAALFLGVEMGKKFFDQALWTT